MTEEINKGGRPAHEPTEDTISLCRTLAGYGVPQKEIARQIGIHDETLRIHYREELDAGVAQANAAVAQSLYQKAVSKDGPQSAAAAMFWLKTRANWKETKAHEHSGPNGGPMQMVDLSKLDDNQLDALESVFGGIAESGSDDAPDQGGETA